MRQMTERAFLTDTWDDGWFQELSRDQRYLFIYLGTNNHCNQAGVYHITLATMAFETKFSAEELPGILKALSPKVEWYAEPNYIWVRSFIKQQAKSPKFLIAVARCLKNLKPNGLAKEVIDYNFKEYTISIPYEYDTERVSVGYPYTTDTSLTPTTDTDTISDPGSGTGRTGEIGVVKGEDKTSRKEGNATPHSRMEAEETLCEGDREVISVWCSVKGFKMTPADASALVASLRTEFPEVDLLTESKRWAARKLSEPLKDNSRPSQQIWNWIEMTRKFARQRSMKNEKGQARRVTGGNPPGVFGQGPWYAGS